MRTRLNVTMTPKTFNVDQTHPEETFMYFRVGELVRVCGGLFRVLKPLTVVGFWKGGLILPILPCDDLDLLETKNLTVKQLQTDGFLEAV